MADQNEVKPQTDEEMRDIIRKWDEQIISSYPDKSKAKLRIIQINDPKGCPLRDCLLLADDEGALPGQYEVTITQEFDKYPSITVKFRIDGKAVRFDCDKEDSSEAR